MPNISVCIPSRSLHAPEFTMCLVNAVSHAAVSGLGMGLSSVSGAILPANREKMADVTLGLDGATHLMFLDDDMTFPVDTITRLVSHDKQIVAANYVKRCDPPTPVTVGVDGKPVYTTAESTGLERVSTTGTGVMLIAVEVFRSLTRPWFDTFYSLQSGTWHTEDVVFCNKAAEAGIATWIDHDLSKEVGHMGTREYRWNL